MTHPSNAPFRIHPLTDRHRPWAADLWRERWGGTTMVTRGRLHHIADLPGFVALAGETLVGLATYHLEDDACEMVSLDSLHAGRGIGSALITAVRGVAARTGAARLWLITTNDNLPALRFYQRRGFALAALHRDAVTAARRRKPEIPLLGLDGIPLRDELELELPLHGNPGSHP